MSRYQDMADEDWSLPIVPASWSWRLRALKLPWPTIGISSRLVSELYCADHLW